MNTKHRKVVEIVTKLLDQARKGEVRAVLMGYVLTEEGCSVAEFAGPVDDLEHCFLDLADARDKVIHEENIRPSCEHLSHQLVMFHPVLLATALATIAHMLAKADEADTGITASDVAQRFIDAALAKLGTGHDDADVLSHHTNHTRH